MTFFFVLSGFVLTWSASAQVSQSTFYWRRFARIYPSHFVALLFAIPVFYTFNLDGAPEWMRPVSVGILALSVVLLQGWSLNPDVLFSGNPAAWTLTCEAFFYALHPFISRVLTPLAKRGALLFAATAISIAFAYRAFALHDASGVLASVPIPVVRITEFVLGMALAWAFRRGWRPQLPVTAGIGATAIVIAAIATLPLLMPGSLLAATVAGYANELFTVACGLAIIAIAKRSLDGKKSAFAARIHVLLGEWSFAFYLVHATFVYLVLALIGRQQESWGNLGWFVVVLALALGGAAALHYCVEKPMEKRMRAWKDARVRV